MKAVIDVACGHCRAEAGQPCRSVGGRVIVSPHMKRLDAAGVTHGRGDILAADHAYCEAALLSVFGYVTPELRQRALKDRAIDLTAKWVKQALGRPALACAHPRVEEFEEERFDPLFGDVPTEKIAHRVCKDCGANVPPDPSPEGLSGGAT